MAITFENPGAFAALSEPVSWRQDRAPHRSGILGAVVLHGAPDSTNAGNPLAAQLADPWSVIVSDPCVLAHDIAVGDTFTYLDNLLTVQQIARDSSGWIFTCTSDERPPR